jgi:hypothetical protein
VKSRSGWVALIGSFAARHDRLLASRKCASGINSLCASARPTAARNASSRRASFEIADTEHST